MSSEANIKRKPRFRYSHGVLFQFLKAAAIGALAGLGIVVVNEVFSKRNKIIVNKYHRRLPIKDLEGLGEEPELCEYFHMMNVKQFRSYNTKAYDTALEKAADLCFLGESIANGILDEFIPQIRAGKLNPFTQLTYDTEALNLWYEVHDNLQTLYNSVRDTESEKVETRDRQEEEYKRDVSKWEHDLVNWQSRKLQHERAKETENMFDFTESDDKVGIAVVNDPEPQKPVEPIYEKFRSDFAEEYATAIDNRTRQVFVYIRDTLDKFRKANTEAAHANSERRRKSAHFEGPMTLSDSETQIK
jgi:hypothetical protein